MSPRPITRARPDDLSRRAFFGRAGAGVLASGAAGACTRLGVDDVDRERDRDRDRERDRPPEAGRFGRLFPDLPAFARPTDALAEALIDLGRPGGPLDARDPLDAGPVRLITEAGLRAGNPDNPDHTAGTTFLGQFVDHDVTFDRSSRLGVPTDPASVANLRSPALDLDSLYGGGPGRDPLLYERDDRARLRIERTGPFEDLPRDNRGVAIISEARNDENLMVAGLHAAMIRFHNAVVDDDGRRRRDERGHRDGRDETFERARQLVTWHYQWIVLHELLPQMVGRDMVDDVLRAGRRWYRADRPVMPVEFQGAAYRFGHSMVRPSYRANLAGDRREPFFGMIFDPAGEGQDDPVDLRGGVRAPRRFVDWQTFFDFGDGEVKPNKAIDAKLSTPLFRLPLGTIADGQPPTSLATRNLLRQVTWSLPAGQDVARTMGVAPLAPGDLPDLAAYGLGLERRTPLWYYVLREAAVQAEGRHLGPVGARIVAEVLIGLLQLDRGSFLNARPAWKPTLPTRSGTVTGGFTMVDLLTVAGVDPSSRRRAAAPGGR
jgi:hypothetical protein